MYIMLSQQHNQTNRIFQIYQNLIARVSMKFTGWNAPHLRYNTLEKLKLSSMLDSITTERMFGN